MIFLYNIFIAAYRVGVQLASMGNTKAKQWLAGRKNLFATLEKSALCQEDIIWIHSSSAGEFEQAKPVIEKLKKNYPNYKILVTFFSPSGYNTARKYPFADYIFYLPADTAANAQRFLDIVKPKLAIFVKYDFWYHHLKATKARNIPLLLISAVFRKDQIFFKWYGSFYRNILHFFNWLCVQDENSFRLLQQHQIIHCSISGDTRFDRVKEIADHFTEVDFTQEFIGTHQTIVAGSTWPDDEEKLSELLVALPSKVKLIIAPHEITGSHIEKILKLFPNAVLYSQLKTGAALHPSAQTLVIDNVGMLSRLYKYATITFVGGGFTKDGIHNTLEAAVYGKPVVFGPNYEKYREAKELLNAGGGFSFSNGEELKTIIKNLISNEALYKKASGASLQYINDHKGATDTIIELIYKNRLLTR